MALNLWRYPMTWKVKSMTLRLLLQDYAQHKTKRSCPTHHDIFNDQHRTSYPPCSKSPVEIPWAHPPSPRRRACIHSIFHLIAALDQDAQPILFSLHSTVAGVRWRQYTSRPDGHDCQRSKCMEKSCSRLLHSQRLMMNTDCGVIWRYAMYLPTQPHPLLVCVSYREDMQNTWMNIHWTNYFLIKSMFLLKY